MSKATFSWTNIKNQLNSSQKQYPFDSSNYVVSFGSIITSFSKISGISLKTTEYMPMNEGGSDEPYILLDQNKNFNTITFEKGLGICFQGNKLTDMLELIKEVKIRDMLLIIYDNKKEAKKAYYTDTAYVKDIVLSDLNAIGQEVLIQSMTVVYDVFKEAKDSSGSGNKESIPTISNVGTVSKNSSKEDSSNTEKTNTVLQKSNENKDITKANLQNNSVSEKEKKELQAKKEKEKLEKQKKIQACF